MDWERTLKIAKVDTEKRQVFGVLSEIVDKAGNPIVDTQGDIIPVDELEKAAYRHVVEFAETDEMHKGGAVGHLIESFVSTPEKRASMGGDPADQSVYWWVGYEVSPETFAKVKTGELAAFSIGGSAHREAA